MQHVVIPVSHGRRAKELALPLLRVRERPQRAQLQLQIKDAFVLEPEGKMTSDGNVGINNRPLYLSEDAEKRLHNPENEL
jgi:hypothetical protein